MKLTASRNIKYLFLTHFVFLIFIALYSFFIIQRLAIQVLVPPYLLICIFTIYSRLFLPISAGALFLLIMLTDKNKSLENSSESGIILLFSTIPISVPTALIYFFLVFFAEPGLIEKKEWLEELSKAGEFYLIEAEKNTKEGNLEDALAFVDLYLYIDQNNKKAIDIKNDIKIAWPDNVYSDEISGEKVKAVSGDILTGQKLLDIAEEYYKLGDFSSAAYYGQMAGGFKSSRTKAAIVVKNAMSKLSGFAPNTSKEEKLYDGKINISKRIESGDFYGAYYLYHQLSEEFPEDQELVNNIGKRLFSFLEESSFFYEDARALYFAPGKTEIAFINGRDPGKELIFVKKIVFTSDSIYFFDIDIINLSASGNIDRHIKALYGKAIGNTLNMQCMGKDTRLLLYPEIIVGNRNDRISSVDLEIPHEAFLYMGMEKSRFLKIKTSFLLSNLMLLTESGAGKYAPEETLFIRFIRFFNYIFMLLLVISAGISFLKRRIVKTYLSLLILPIAVVAIYFLERSIIYIKSGILSIFIKETGITGAAVCCTVIISVELIATIFYTIAKASSINNFKQ